MKRRPIRRAAKAVVRYTWQSLVISGWSFYPFGPYPYGPDGEFTPDGKPRDAR